MTAFSGRRAFIFIIFLLLAIALLSAKYNQPQGTLSSSQQSSIQSNTGSNSTGSSSSSVTGSSNQPLNGITVMVANGTSSSTAETFFLNILKNDGATTLPPADAIPAGSSTIYYIQGQQQAANSVAGDLGLPNSSVAPMPTGALPVTSLGTAQVLVVVGPNLISKMTPTTT